jgi:hypothetical protein
LLSSKSGLGILSAASAATSGGLPSVLSELHTFASRELVLHAGRGVRAGRAVEEFEPAETRREQRLGARTPRKRCPRARSSALGGKELNQRAAMGGDREERSTVQA